jgi:hypothetical protein
LLATCAIAQEDLDSCYRKTGVAIIESDVRAEATIRAGLLGLVDGLGDRDAAREFRKLLADRTFKQDEIVRKKIENGFTVEIYFPPVPDHRGKTRAYLERFGGRFLKVPREWPITILFQEGKPRKVIRVWQAPKYNSRELIALVRKALERHFLEDDPDALLSVASRCLEESELANAALICERVQSLATDAEVKKEAAVIRSDANGAFDQGVKARKVKQYRGWKERQRRAARVEPGKGMKLKRVNHYVTYEFPDAAPWQDLRTWAVGAKLKRGLLLINTGSFVARPPPKVEPTITFNGRRFNLSNLSRFAKELQRSLKDDFKRVRRATKPRDYRIKKGECVGFDMVVRGGQTRNGSRLLQRFTDQAATMDATRVWNPRRITMHLRQLVVGGDSGTLIVYMLATEGVFRAYRKEIRKVIRSFRVE